MRASRGQAAAGQQLSQSQSLRACFLQPPIACNPQSYDHQRVASKPRSTQSDLLPTRSPCQAPSQTKLLNQVTIDTSSVSAIRRVFAMQTMHTQARCCHSSMLQRVVSHPARVAARGHCRPKRIPAAFASKIQPAHSEHVVLVDPLAPTRCGSVCATWSVCFAQFGHLSDCHALLLAARRPWQYGVMILLLIQ